MTRVTRAVRYDARHWISRYRIYLPYARRRAVYSDAVVRPETQVLIEGFPRSGSSFALVATRFAQDASVNIAHHLHSAANVKEAIRLGVPTLLLVRNPADVALSEKIRNPAITLRQALRAYVAYYDAVMPYAPKVTVADFEQVTGNFSDVISRLNRRYGLDLKLFEHTPENVARCFRIIESWRTPESLTPRPSPHRDALKEALSRDLRRGELSRILRRATDLYEAIKPLST